MKKNLLTIIIFILIIPTVVFAASTCNPSDIEIETVTMSKTVGNATEVTAASIENKSINLDVKLNDPNDYIEYIIKVRNSGTEDYYIKDADFNNDQYLKYEFVHENNTFKIEPGEEKEITLRVSYKNRVEGNANYTSTDSLTLNILDKQDISVANTLMNLNLGVKILIVLVIIAIIAGLVILFVNNKKSRKMLILFIGVVLLLPVNSDASCDAKIDVDVKVELDSKNAIFKPGPEVNILMKTLAGTTIGEDGAYTLNETIVAFKKADSEPPQLYRNIASIDGSIPIYVWFEENDDTIYWWSEDETPSLGEDASFFFAGLNKVTSLEGAATFDVSNTTDLSNAFSACYVLPNIDFFTNWNTSKVTTLEYSFYGFRAVTDFTPLANLNVSNVTNMNETFGQNGFTSIEFLSNWDVSKVEEMYCMFFNDPFLLNLNGIENWNVSNVKIMAGLFANNYSLTNVDALANWNTSSVETMEAMFYYDSELTTVQGIESFDTSNVTNINSMFSRCAKLKNVDLHKWDTSKVTNMSDLFADSALTTADFTGWNTSNVTSMAYMFNSIYASVLDLSSFDTRKVTSFKRMFNGAAGLTTIYIGEYWDTSANTDEELYIFDANATHLPNFDPNNEDKQKIINAKPTTEGGYLTLKTND